MNSGIVKDRRYMEHDMGAFHPENPQRIEAINRMIEEEIDFPYIEIKPKSAEEEEVDEKHLQRLKDLGYL